MNRTPVEEQEPGICDLPAGFEALHGPAAIARAVDRLAAGITARHRNRELMVVAVLDGALVFTADLLRRLPMTTRLATLRASSYRTPDRVQLNYKVAGEGRPTLILIHGWASRLDHWQPVASALARYHRVLRIESEVHRVDPR